MAHPFPIDRRSKRGLSGERSGASRTRPVAPFVETLEGRRLLSSSLASAPQPAPGILRPHVAGNASVVARTIRASKSTYYLKQHVAYSGEIGVLAGLAKGATYSATIDWGDATAYGATNAVVDPAGYAHFVGTHTYDSGGVFFITLKVHDGRGSLIATIVSKSVVAGTSNNSAGGTTIHGVARQTASGEIGVFNYPVIRPVRNPFPLQVSVDWGDGQTGVGKLNENGHGGYDITGATPTRTPGHSESPSSSGGSVRASRQAGRWSSSSTAPRWSH